MDSTITIKSFWPFNAWRHPIKWSDTRYLNSISGMISFVQVNIYDIDLNFFHISHNLTCYCSGCNCPISYQNLPSLFNWWTDKTICVKNCTIYLKKNNLLASGCHKEILNCLWAMSSRDVFFPFFQVLQLSKYNMYCSQKFTKVCMCLTYFSV